MPDDKEKKEFRSDDFTSDAESSDFGALTGGGDLGNLPPLSEFESSDGSGIDSGLPPLSDIDVDTPVPGGSPPSYRGDSGFDTPGSDPGISTPGREPARRGGTGFQDLAADSDFSPETPEIGPGPDSDLETPMFDSAFGGSGADFSSTPTPDTSAPTQAMETPMFGQASFGGPSPVLPADEVGFAPGAFGGARSGAPAFGQPGTPAPDFQTDGGAVSGVSMGPAPVAAPAKGGGLKAVIAALVAAVIGIVAGPWVASYLPLPNPMSSKVTELEAQITQQQATITRLQALPQTDTGVTVDMEALLKEKEAVAAEVAALKEQAAGLETQAQQTEERLAAATEDLEKKMDAFVSLEQQYEDLLNEVSIMSARHEGLIAEVDRLNGLVGTQEEANARRMAVKAAFESAVGQLVIQIREGIPLTPEKYNREARLAAAEALLARAQESNNVTPELFEDYNRLFLKEMEIAASNEYFFAKIPVHDRFGSVYEKWAECKMNGNWSVFFRTIDGKNVGSYENVSQGETPRYAFREDLPPIVQKSIEQEVIAARTPGHEEKLLMLADKQAVVSSKTPFQRVFDSL